MFSVHLSPFPEINPKWLLIRNLHSDGSDLLHVRSQVQAKLEEKRREKTIGSSLGSQGNSVCSRSKSSLICLPKALRDVSLNALYCVAG